MLTKMLCDQCKREFEADEDLMNYMGEVICPDCIKDRDDILELNCPDCEQDLEIME